MENIETAIKLNVFENAENGKFILERLRGQLSDGMWSNSRRMEPYWKMLRRIEIIDGNLCIVVFNSSHFYNELYLYDGKRPYTSGPRRANPYAEYFDNKNSDKLANWIKRKINAILKQSVELDYEYEDINAKLENETLKDYTKRVYKRNINNNNIAGLFIDKYENVKISVGEICKFLKELIDNNVEKENIKK